MYEISTLLYVGYSGSKYRLRISLAHPRDCHFAHVQWLPSYNWKDTDAISWNSCYVYVCSCVSNMFKTTEGAADCEIRSVIRFLNARNVVPSEIHHQICHVYGDNAMSDGMVRKWIRMFIEGRENVHYEARSGRPSLVNDDWCVRSKKECVKTDVSQFLICPCTFLRFQGSYSMTLPVVI